MFRAQAKLAILAALALFAGAPAASAAWLGYKNETNAPVVVQTTMLINKQIVRGKAHVLYPGEIAWDNIPAPSTRTLSIYDPKANNKLIHQDTVTVANADIFLGVQSFVPPAQPGKPAPQPVIKLAVTRAPVAPGVVPNPAAKPGAPATPVKPGTPINPTPTPTKPGTPTSPTPAPTKPGTPAPAPTPTKPAPTPPSKPQEQPKPTTPPKPAKSPA